MVYLWTTRSLPKSLEFCEEKCLSCPLVWLYLLFKSYHLFLESVFIVNECEIHLVDTANDEFDHLINLILIVSIFLEINVVQGYGI